MGVVAALTAIGTALTAGAATGTAAAVIGGVVVAGATAGVVGTVKAGKAAEKAYQAQGLEKLKHVPQTYKLNGNVEQLFVPISLLQHEQEPLHSQLAQHKAPV